jgi:hypothetical protein
MARHLSLKIAPLKDAVPLAFPHQVCAVSFQMFDELASLHHLSGLMIPQVKLPVEMKVSGVLRPGEPTLVIPRREDADLRSRAGRHSISKL